MQSTEPERTSGHSRDFEVYLHLGPHKTGTTYFQSCLEANEARLNAAGVGLVTVRSDMSGRYNEARIRYTRILQKFLLDRPTDETPVIKELAAAIQQIVSILPEASFRKAVISDENLLGPMPGHDFAGQRGRETGVYPAREIVMEAFKMALGDSLKSVLLCRRTAYELVVSSYRDQVAKLLHSETPLEFFSVLDDNLHDQFDEFYRYFQKIPVPRLLLTEFQEFTTNPTSIVAEWLDADLELDLQPVTTMNQSMSWAAVACALDQVDLVLDDDVSKRQLRRRLLREFQNAPVPRWIEEQLQVLREKL